MHYDSHDIIQTYTKRTKLTSSNFMKIDTRDMGPSQ